MRVSRIGVLSVLLLLTVGCTTTNRSKRAIAQSSPFLGSYRGFVHGPASTLVYKAPGVRFEQYTAVVVQPLTVFYLERAGYKGVHPENVNRLSEMYRESAERILAEEFQIVSKYEPGTLIVRAGIRGLQPTPSGASPFHFSQSIMEYEIVDPLGGRLLAVVYRPLGHEPPRKGPWGRAESVVNYWNRLLTTHLVSLGVSRRSKMPPLQRTQ
ncbi:MAG: hypothetical protein ACI8W8_001548 [Rhodothermales bacterium]|jgi:hypothetical protein